MVTPAPGAKPDLNVLAAADIAVFVGQNIPAAERELLVARQPSWLAALVFASVASCSRDLATVDVELAAEDDVPRCAFAAICAGYAAGAFEQTPARYLVRAGALGSVVVTASFDDESETWLGDVRRADD